MHIINHKKLRTLNSKIKRALNLDIDHLEHRKSRCPVLVLEVSFLGGTVRL